MYKKLLVNLYEGGFYNAGFISLTNVKKMEDSKDKEVLLNIFKYGIANDNEKIEDAFIYFKSDDFKPESDLVKSDYSTENKFHKLLSEKSQERDCDFFEELDLISVYSEDLDEIFVDYISSISEILKSILKKKEIEEGIDEYDFYLKFEECEYDEEKVLKIDAPFKEF